MSSLTSQETSLEDEDVDAVVPAPGKHRATPDEPAEKPGRQATIEAIVTDPDVIEHLGYTPDLDFADRIIDWINETIVERSRVLDYGWVYPSTRRMKMPEYKGFDALFGHAETPQVGSAGETVCKHLLKGNETGIWHDIVGEGKLAHCGARVLVGSV